MDYLPGYRSQILESLGALSQLNSGSVERTGQSSFMPGESGVNTLAAQQMLGLQQGPSGGGVAPAVQMPAAPAMNFTFSPTYQAPTMPSIQIPQMQLPQIQLPNSPPPQQSYIPPLPQPMPQSSQQPMIQPQGGGRSQPQRPLNQESGMPPQRPNQGSTSGPATWSTPGGNPYGNSNPWGVPNVSIGGTSNPWGVPTTPVLGVGYRGR